MADKDKNKDATLWQRPEGCTCNYVVEEPTTANMSLVRVIDDTCPLHGDLEDVLSYLEKIIMDHLKTVPGGHKVSSVMANRILKALVPALLEDETLDKLLTSRAPQKAQEVITEPSGKKVK